jgi:Xaa-Pro aminopeptidase
VRVRARQVVLAQMLAKTYACGDGRGKRARPRRNPEIAIMPCKLRHLASIAALALLLGPGGSASAQAGSPAGPVPPDLLQARRSALLERIGSGIAVVASAETRSIEGDYPQDSDYREANAFFYLTGLEAPGGRLVLLARSGSADSVVLYLPARDPAAEQWTGPRLGPGSEAQAITGISDVRAADAFDADVLHWTDAGLARIDNVHAQIAALRLVKDGDELRRLREAIRITAEAHRAAATALEPGMWEYQLEAVIEFTFRWFGAERVGFPSIIGSGPFATILHYDRSRRQMQSGDLVVVDIGAEYGYYSADVTRTYPVSGTFTPRQRAVYDLVLASQQAAIDSVRPGTTMARLNAIARAHMRANSGDVCGARTCDTYFVHGLSHWLGMDVHDVGDNSTPLAPGMVLTIEPGVYIPGEQIGVRIEDDVLVTATGHELLSGHAPRTAAAVEQLMTQVRSARALQR